MPSEKRSLLQQFVIWAWQKNLASRIFAKITKLSLQQVGKTSWQIGIHIMPSDGGLGIFAK